MLNVQKYLLNLRTLKKNEEECLDILEEKHKIRYKIEEDCIVLNYTQFVSDKFEPIVQECRGLILSRDFKTVLCKPFNRFFNYGENPAIDNIFHFEKSYVTEKIDGSLINFWWNPYKEKWIFSTRGNAYLDKNEDTKVFYKNIMKAIGKNADLENFFGEAAKSYTFSFELVSPDTQVVKYYSEPALYFLAVHRNSDGKELPKEEFYQLIKHNKEKLQKNDAFKNVKYPKEHHLTNLKAIKLLIDYLEDEDEGYVVQDDTGVRIKVKNPKYLALAHLKNNGILSKETIIDLLENGEESEYTIYFPMDGKRIKPYKEAYEKLKENALNEWESVKHIKVQKDFALAIKNNDYKTFLFGMKSGKPFEKCFSGLTIRSKIDWIEKFIEDN